MAATSLPSKTLQNNYLSQLQSSFPDLCFTADKSFYWSPKQQTVYFVQAALDEFEGLFALLHETAHGVLGHKTYEYDYQLLQMELEAWTKAKEIAANLGIEIDGDHIEDCMDTYRDWLHGRSACPTCGVVSLQLKSHIYRCHNCNNTWRVSRSRFCRPYRIKK